MSHDDVFQRALALARERGVNIYVAIAIALQQPNAQVQHLIPCPPDLDRAFGYWGEAPYVALYWSKQGDEAVYEDGQLSGTGDWQVYLLFTQHPLITPFLQNVNLGNRTTEHTHALVLNRSTRQLQCWETAAVTTMLHEQRLLPALMEASILNEETVQQLLRRYRMRTTSTPEQDLSALAEQRTRYEAIQIWLDKRFVASGATMPDDQVVEESE